MLEARRRMAAGEHEPFVVIAETQTGGVGRLGRPWSSPRGGVWLTVAVPQQPGAAIDPLTSVRVAATVWSVCSASLRSDWTGRPATDLFDSPLRMKWPNDLVDSSAASAKKIAGVLIERIAVPAVLLCGVGVNVNNDPATLPDEVARRATSLHAARAHAYDEREVAALSERLIASLADELTRRKADAGDDLTLATFSEFMWRPAQDVPITMPGGERLLGRIIDVTRDGGLRVRIDGQERELRSVDQIG